MKRLPPLQKKEAGLAAAIAFERMVLVVSYAAPPDFVEAALQNLKDKYRAPESPPPNIPYTLLQ